MERKRPGITERNWSLRSRSQPTLPMQVGQKTTEFVVTGLANGDSVKSGNPVIRVS
ncbi:MAG: hypothetical protein ACLTNO_07690 [Blautia sp.]